MQMLKMPGEESYLCRGRWAEMIKNIGWFPQDTVTNTSQILKKPPVQGKKEF